MKPLTEQNRAELAATYVERIGYDPFQDSPALTDDEVRQTLREHAEEAANAERLSLVAAEFDCDGVHDSETFPGFHDPSERWNGWACPYFTREVADRIAAAVSKHSNYGPARFDEAKQAYVFPSGEGDEVDTYYALVVGGRILWSVGAFGWCWSVKGEDSDL